jgi:hypothetical protein
MATITVEQLLAADHTLREEQVKLLQAQAKQYKETSERGKGEAQAKKVQNCDGSSPQRLREWFRDIDMTKSYTARTVYVASLTAEGALRVELEKYLNSLANRANATWDGLRVHLQKSFLSQHEAERLRDEVETVIRQPYETTTSYGRRFSEAADIAYPAANRNADQQRVMLRAYMKGLNNEKLVLRLVQERGPADYLEAIEAVAKYEADSYTVYRALNGAAPPERFEEPMEVSEYKSKDVTASAGDTAQKQLNDIRRQVTGLSREFTKLMAQGRKPVKGEATREHRQKQQGTSNGYQTPRRRPPLKFTSDGKPICARCDQPGHMRRECTARPQYQQRQSQHAGGY